MAWYKKIIILLAVISIITACNRNRYLSNVKLYETLGDSLVLIEDLPDSITSELEAYDVLATYDDSTVEDYIMIDTLTNTILLSEDTVQVWSDSLLDDIADIEIIDTKIDEICQDTLLEGDTVLDAKEALLAAKDTLIGEKETPEKDSSLYLIYTELKRMREMMEAENMRDTALVKKDTLKYRNRDTVWAVENKLPPARYSKTNDKMSEIDSIQNKRLADLEKQLQQPDSTFVRGKSKDISTTLDSVKAKYPDTVFVIREADILNKISRNPQSAYRREDTKRTAPDTVIVIREIVEKTPDTVIVVREVLPPAYTDANRRNYDNTYRDNDRRNDGWDNRGNNRRDNRRNNNRNNPGLNGVVVINNSDNKKAAPDTVVVVKETINSNDAEKAKLDSLNAKYNKLVSRNTKDTENLTDSINALKKQIAEAKTRIEYREVVVTKTVEVNNLDTVNIVANYNVNKTNPNNYNQIINNLNTIDWSRVKSIWLSGYTDIAGSYQVNKKLTDQRLENMRNILVKRGINERIIFIQNFSNKYASQQVIDSERRIDIAVVYKKN